MKKLRNVLVVLLSVVMLFSMSGCSVLFNISANNKPISTPVIEDETDETTEAPTEEEKPFRAEFGEDGKLIFTNHKYGNIGIYAHDGVTTMELNGVRQVLNKIIKPGMTDVERIKAVHDWIAKHTTYVEDYYSLDTSRSFIYNLVYNKTAICQGYAVTFYVMMVELGIECTIISGDAGGPHAWNAVKLDGNWYYVDVTWDDPGLTTTGDNAFEDGSNITYNYLLCTYDYISETHSEDAYRPNQPTPKGVVDSYNRKVYELDGYKGVYRITDYKYQDALDIGEVICEPGKYMIYINDGTSVDKVLKDVKTAIAFKNLNMYGYDVVWYLYSDAIKVVFTEQEE